MPCSRGIFPVNREACPGAVSVMACSERHLREILALAAQAREPAVRRQPVDTLAQQPGGELIDYDGDRDGGVLPLGRRRDHAGNRGKSRRRNWNAAGSRSGSRSHRAWQPAWPALGPAGPLAGRQSAARDRSQNEVIQS